MNVLIAGGTGLIGKALVSALSADKYQTKILTRNPLKARESLPSTATPFQWDGRTTQGWSHLIEDSDVVINLAGESIAGETLPAILTRRWTPEQIRRIEISRLDTGQALVSAIQDAKRKPRLFIQASAVGYYGPRQDEDIPETTPTGIDTLAQICQKWERSTASLETLGVRRVVIRTGLVLSTSGGILPMMLLPIRLFVGGPIGSGSQYVPWIHIEDQVNAIQFLLQDNSSRGVYNLTSPNPVRQREFAKIAGQILQRPSFFPIPGFALKLLMGEKASLVLDGQRVLPRRLIEAGYEDLYRCKQRYPQLFEHIPQESLQERSNGRLVSRKGVESVARHPKRPGPIVLQIQVILEKSGLNWRVLPEASF